MEETKAYIEGSEALTRGTESVQCYRNSSETNGRATWYLSSTSLPKTGGMKCLSELQGEIEPGITQYNVTTQRKACSSKDELHLHVSEV